MIDRKYTCKIKKLKKLEPNTTINLVLSGGGVKGVAHIALFEKLEELNIKINSISGTSVGALIGAMYASGTRPKDILKFCQKNDLFQYSWFTIAKPSIFNLNKYAPLIRQYIKPNFEDLDIPLTVSTTNLNRGTTRYFKEGPLLRPLLASCAIPFVFNPIEIDSEMYNDGAILNNFPLKPFKKSEYPVIGSNIFKVSDKNNKQLDSTLKILSHSLKLLSQAAEEPKLKKTFATICFPLDKYSGMDSKEVDKIYKTAKEYIEEHL